VKLLDATGSGKFKTVASNLKIRTPQLAKWQRKSNGLTYIFRGFQLPNGVVAMLYD
jgi:hypothetical protein